MDRLARNFEEDQYYVTGNVDRSIFAENCIFTDPSIRVEGTEKYASAVAALFDAATSKADLISIQVVDASTIDLTWRLEGVLTRGGLRIKPYTGSTRYTAGVDGRVVRQEETWSISVLDAFVSCFFPSFGSPPAPPADELRAALAS